MKTTEEIIIECGFADEGSIGMILQPEFNQNWYSEEEIRKAIEQSTTDIKLGSILVDKDELLKILFSDEK